MIDLTAFMVHLAQIRPVFHSEADFQHTFAWELHRANPEWKIRLELPWDEGQKQNHLDIWAESDDCRLAIELKYKTRGLNTRVNGENFHLRDQAAQDLGRYDFLKDITRLEFLASRFQNFIGYAILLTNDSAYWKTTEERSSASANFRLHERQLAAGSLAWGKDTGIGTMRKREKPVILRQDYPLTWRDYASSSQEMYGKFRYLALVIQ